MRFDAQCIDCLVRRQRSLADERGEPEKSYLFMRDVLQAILDAPEGVAAPYLIPKFDEAFQKYWPGTDPYAELKRMSNDFMMARLPKLRAMVEASADPVRTALQLAQVANYIDYGALSENVDPEKLDQKLFSAPDNPVDEKTYTQFLTELESARRMLYIGDNAGEIVADRLLLEALMQRFPHLSITYGVRGGPALNDVTREDAAAVGLDQLVPIVDNGTRISGTELDYIGQEMRQVLEDADVILAKGQANFETLVTSGRNIYYIFLCKCVRFTRLFDVPMLTGMFCRERDLHVETPFY